MIEDKTYIKRKDNNGIIKHPNAVPFDVFWFFQQTCLTNQNFMLYYM
jgi:hypothetical protein